MPHYLDPSILREYDIRGATGETLCDDDAWAIGKSFGTVLRRGGGHRIAVGHDGQATSQSLGAALIKGLVETGCTVLDIGRGPTPMLYFAEAELPVHGAIQVTASLHPTPYNKLKMLCGHRSFCGDDIQELARLAEIGDWIDGEGQGDIAPYNIEYAYIERLIEGLDLQPHKIGWDAGSGATGRIIEQLVERLPGEHHLLRSDLGGKLPKNCSDPSAEKSLGDLRNLVISKKLDFGFAFDGDGDRISAIDSLGRIISGDQLLAILAEPLLKRLPGSTIISDIKVSQTVYERLSSLGGVPLLSKSGHSLIKSKMEECGSPLAGEMSGHIFLSDRWYGFDDALYVALRVIEAVDQQGGSLTALKSRMPDIVNTPEIRFDIGGHRKLAVIEEVSKRLKLSGADVNCIDGVRVNKRGGWWLLRASQTQEVLLARAEAPSTEVLYQLLQDLDGQLHASGVPGASFN